MARSFYDAKVSSSTSKSFYEEKEYVKVSYQGVGVEIGRSRGYYPANDDDDNDRYAISPSGNRSNSCARSGMGKVRDTYEEAKKETARFLEKYCGL